MSEVNSYAVSLCVEVIGRVFEVVTLDGVLWLIVLECNAQRAIRPNSGYNLLHILGDYLFGTSEYHDLCRRN